MAGVTRRELCGGRQSSWDWLQYAGCFQDGLGSEGGFTSMVVPFSSALLRQCYGDQCVDTLLFFIL